MVAAMGILSNHAQSQLQVTGYTHHASSAGAWALKHKIPPGALTKGGVSIQCTKRNMSAYPCEGIDWNMGIHLRTL